MASVRAVIALLEHRRDWSAASTLLQFCSSRCERDVAPGGPDVCGPWASLLDDTDETEHAELRVVASVLGAHWANLDVEAGVCLEDLLLDGTVRDGQGECERCVRLKPLRLAVLAGAKQCHDGFAGCGVGHSDSCDHVDEPALIACSHDGVGAAKGQVDRGLGCARGWQHRGSRSLGDGEHG